MPNLILTGAAGKMGQAILRLLPNFPKIELVGAIEAVGHLDIGKVYYKNVVLSNNLSQIIKKADVVVDFTSAEPSMSNLKIVTATKKPIIIGSTGHDKEQIEHIAELSRNIAIVYSPNMSVGVNLMWKLIDVAGRVLGKDYKIEITEAHHAQKKDAPSGTAKKMLEILNKCGMEAPRQSSRQAGTENAISVKSIREGNIVGNHTITFTSPYEQLEITHRALSRDVFAAGALRAAEWIVDKKSGLYDMGDVLYP